MVTQDTVDLLVRKGSLRHAVDLVRHKTTRHRLLLKAFRIENYHADPFNVKSSDPTLYKGAWLWRHCRRSNTLSKKILPSALVYYVLALIQ